MKYGFFITQIEIYRMLVLVEMVKCLFGNVLCYKVCNRLKEMHLSKKCTCPTAVSLYQALQLSGCCVMVFITRSANLYKFEPFLTEWNTDE